MVSMEEMLEAGAHFGHATNRLNPKMTPYIFGERNGIHILDLGRTARLFREVTEFVLKLSAEGRTILFVGTKLQAQEIIAEEASRCGMPYVDRRWPGGLLTNFAIVQKSLSKLMDLERMEMDGRFDTLTKKEVAQHRKERYRLARSLEGVRSLSRLPDAVFIVDTGRESIAAREARSLKVAVIGLVDTNGDPEEMDFVIPSNNDSSRSIRLFTSKIANAVLSGRETALTESRAGAELSIHETPKWREQRLAQWRKERARLAHA
jgi:small subunit ribosomal protein S2